MRYPRSRGARLAWTYVNARGKITWWLVDYLTDFFEVAELSNTLASAVVNAAKQQFARHGIPIIVHTDGGLQFMSQ